MHLVGNGPIAVAGSQQTDHLQLAGSQLQVGIARLVGLARSPLGADALQQVREKLGCDTQAAAQGLVGNCPAFQQFYQHRPFFEEGAQEAFLAGQA
ncbi:hypothetical protein D9M68_651500 [compost metagenome]